ncbi:hypothetical protein EON82_24030 [bacterium]|nr:MAG: hypothetical protein EON82_24030 [bacterium]
MLSLSLVALVVLGPQGAKAKQQVKKPVVKPTVIGQVQMPGDNGKLETLYSMGDAGTQLNFRLDKVSFATRAAMVEDTVVADADHKLLILNFTVQNPLKSDQRLTYDNFKFTVVSPDGQNEEFDGWIYHPTLKTRLDTSLKPAQNVQAVAVFPIHAKGPVDKLIVKRGEGKVLRYDLRGKIPALTGTYAASADVAQPEASGKVGTPFELNELDWTVEKVESVTTPIGDYTPEEGEQLIAVTAVAKNPTMKPLGVSYNTVAPSMKDANGETIEWTQDFVSMSSGKTLESTLKPSEQVRGRFLFKAPAAMKPTSLTLADNNTRRSVTIALP